MTSFGLEDDTEVFLDIFFLYFTKIYHLNKIFCSYLVVLPPGLPIFGFLTLYIAFDKN